MCPRINLILARNAEIMRQMATVVEQAVSGNLTPVNGRRDLLVPWQSNQLEWSKEVGDVFAAELDDRALLVKSETKQKEVFASMLTGKSIRPPRRGSNKRASS